MRIELAPSPCRAHDDWSAQTIVDYILPRRTTVIQYLTIFYHIIIITIYYYNRNIS